MEENGKFILTFAISVKVKTASPRIDGIKKD